MFEHQSVWGTSLGHQSGALTDLGKQPVWRASLGKQPICGSSLGQQPVCNPSLGHRPVRAGGGQSGTLDWGTSRPGATAETGTAWGRVVSDSAHAYEDVRLSVQDSLQSEEIPRFSHSRGK